VATAKKIAEVSQEMECFMQALSEYLEAKAEHDKKYADFVESGGTSWGYFGHRCIERVEECAAEIDTRLTEVIDARIKSILQST
jgi:hypothetical protein